MEDFNKPFYHEIEDFNYNKCYLRVRAFQPNESDFCGYINISERNDGSEKQLKLYVKRKPRTGFQTQHFICGQKLPQ